MEKKLYPLWDVLFLVNGVEGIVNLTLEFDAPWTGSEAEFKDRFLGLVNEHYEGSAYLADVREYITANVSSLYVRATTR